MKNKYSEMKNFEREYKEKGAYHYKLRGFEDWFIRDNYRLIAKNVIKNSKVLDLACGEGKLVKYLPVCNVVGVDNSPTALRLARQYSNLTGLVADMRKVPFKSNSFDVITCSLSFQYLLLEDLYNCLIQCSKLLVSNGKLIISYPNILKWRPARTDAAELQQQKLIEIIKAAGFQIKSVRGICLRNPRWLVRLSHKKNMSWIAFLYYNLSRLGYYYPSLSYHYIIVCSWSKNNKLISK